MHCSEDSEDICPARPATTAKVSEGTKFLCYC